jgi:iron complex transport system substrate-binding protein
MNKIPKILILLCLSLIIIFPAAAMGVRDVVKDIEVEEELPETVYVEDSMGNKVPVPKGTDRIICTNSGLSVLLSALGKGDSIVGRDSNSTFPSYLKNVYVVAENSSRPNIELILEKHPDLILADNMMPESAFDKFRSLGIPVAIFKTSDPRAFEHTILNVGALTGSYVQAQRMIGDMKSREKRVTDIVAEAQAAEGSEVKVFYENRKPYASVSSKSGNHIPLAAAGAVNIAADEPVSSPHLSVEYVLEQNPDVIIRRMSGDGSAENMKIMLDMIKNRTGIGSVNAVVNGRVHIMKADLTLLLRYPAALAYMASWVYPDYAELIDPEGVHRNIIAKYFGIEEWENTREVFVYP